MAASVTAGLESSSAADTVAPSDDAVVQRPPRLPDEALLPGPLEIPTIGVAVPDFEERYTALMAARSPAPSPQPAVPPLVPDVAPSVTAPTAAEEPPAEEPPVEGSPAEESPPDEPPVVAAPPTPAAEKASVGPPDQGPTDLGPTDAVPMVEEPTGAQLPVEAPTDAEPPVEEPTDAEPVVEQPPVEEPTNAEPPVQEPTDEEPPVEEPTGAQPPAEEPTDAEPPVEQPPAEQPPAEEPPTDEPEAPADANFRLGDGPTVPDPDTGDTVVALAVDAVVVDVPCAGVEPTGHLIGLQLRLTTGADLAALGDAPALSAADFSVAGADGASVTDPATPACLPGGEAFPTGPVAAGQTVVGTLVLDVPVPAGTLVYRPAFLPGAARWQF